MGEFLESLVLSRVDEIIERCGVFGFYSEGQVKELGGICKWLHEQKVSLEKDISIILGRVKDSDNLLKELAIANAVIRELVPHSGNLSEAEIKDFIANKKASFSFLKRMAVS